VFVENLRAKRRALRTRKNRAVLGRGGDSDDSNGLEFEIGVASHSTRKKDAREEDRDAKGPNSRFEWFFQGCNGAGGRRPAAGGLRLPTRTLVRFLGLIGCRPAPRLVPEESGGPFYGYHVVPSFFFFFLFRSHPFEAGY
jgi:hypothetical protein